MSETDKLPAAVRDRIVAEARGRVNDAVVILDFEHNNAPGSLDYGTSTSYLRQHLPKFGIWAAREAYRFGVQQGARVPRATRKTRRESKHHAD